MKAVCQQLFAAGLMAIGVWFVAPPALAEDPPEKLQIDFANGLFAREYYPMAAEEYRKFLAQFPNAEKADEAWFRLAESYRLQNKYEESLAPYRSLAEKFPNSPYWEKAKYRVGEIYYRLKKYPEASQHLNELASKATDKEIKPATLFLLGKIKYDLGQIDEAAQALLALAKSPRSGAYMAYSYFTLAQICLKKNDPAKALAYFKAVLEVKPSETLLPETHYEIARLEFTAQNYPAAAAGYTKILTDYPNSPFIAPSVNGLVAALFQQGKWEECVKAANEYLEKAKPEARPDLLYLAANAQRQLKQWDGAIATYDRLAQKYANWDRLDAALTEQVRCFYEKQDFAKVVASASAFLKRFPKSQLGSAVALLAAEVQFGQSQFAEATKFYDAVLASFPKSAEAPDAGYRKGWSLLAQEKWAEASAAFRSFTQTWPQDPRVPEAIVRSADALRRAGNYAEAIRDYSTFIEKYSSNGFAESALYQLGLCYGETKQFDKMATTLVSFVQKYPNSGSITEANYWLGWNAFRAKKWQDAVGYLTKSLGNPSRAPDAKLKLALSYFFLDQPANAAPLMAELLKMDQAKEIPLEVYHWQAKYHVGAAQHAPALAMFERMRQMIDEKKMPGWAVTANLGYGEAALALQKYGEALPAFQKVIELAPESAQAIEAYMGEGSVFLATKKFTEGEAVVDKLLTLQPEGEANARARMMLGELLMAQEKYADAAKHFQTVALLFEDPELTPDALSKAAKCLESSGQAEAAQKTLEELKQRFPDYQPK